VGFLNLPFLKTGFKMILLTMDQIKEIAEQLDCGFSCFINKKTREMIFLYGDEDNFFTTEEDAWADERKKIRKKPGDYLEVEKMESRDSFRVMEGFAETVDSVKLRQDLMQVLNQKKPFSKFKYVIDCSGEYREKWFAFKAERMQEWVKEQVDMYNRRLVDGFA
jgi:hypothetical protein